MENDSRPRQFERTKENQELSLLIYSEDNLKDLTRKFYENRTRSVLTANEKSVMDYLEIELFLRSLREISLKFSPNLGIKDQENILKQEEEKIRDINAKLSEIGIVKVADTTEYKVNRKNSEVAEEMGIKGFPELELALIDFYEKYGIYKDDSTAGKLISMSWGCGNAGGLLERRLQKENPTNREIDLAKHYEYFGCADSIYSSLDDLMYKFIKPELKNEFNLIFREFVSILSVLILRAHRLAKFEDKKINSKDHSKNIFSDATRDKLKKITQNINFLKDIICLLDEARVVNKDDAKHGKIKYLADLEYASEKTVKIENYFVRELFKELASCFFDQQGNKKPDFKDQVSSFMGKYFEDNLLNESSDLNKYHEIHSHNVFLMDFQEAPEIFVNEDQELLNFHLVTAFRSNSHQKRHNYLKSLGTLIEHLAIGGIILDDGDRESYTREEVIDELLDIQEANPEIKIDVIASINGKKLCLLIQKGLKIGEELFFLDESEKKKFILEDKQAIPIKEYKERKIIQNFRSLVISVLKQNRIDNVKIEDNYFLKTNFFRTLNVPIDLKIIDFILQELVRYTVKSLLGEKNFLKSDSDLNSELDKIKSEQSLLQNPQIENNDQVKIIHRQKNIDELLNIILPLENSDLTEEILFRIKREEDFTIDYLLSKIDIPEVENGKDDKIRLKKLVFERILEIFEENGLDISAQTIFNYIDNYDKQNNLIDTIETSPEIKDRIRIAESFIDKYPFVL